MRIAHDHGAMAEAALHGLFTDRLQQIRSHDDIGGDVAGNDAKRAEEDLQCVEKGFRRTVGDVQAQGETGVMGRPAREQPLQARPGGGYRTGGHKRTRARRPGDPRAEFVEGTVEADHRPATLRDRARRRVHQGAAPEGDHGAGAR